MVNLTGRSPHYNNNMIRTAAASHLGGFSRCWAEHEGALNASCRHTLHHSQNSATSRVWWLTSVVSAYPASHPLSSGNCTPASPWGNPLPTVFPTRYAWIIMSPDFVFVPRETVQNPFHSFINTCENKLPLYT